MPRPTNKNDLINAIQREHAALERLLAPLSEDEMEWTPGAEGWSIKDILAHLHAWAQMYLGWYAAGRQGLSPHLPADGYNWAQLPALNAEIYRTHHQLPLANVLTQYRASHATILAAVQQMDEAELFTPGRYGWTNANALAAYVISVTSSHDVWACKEIRKVLRAAAAKPEQARLAG